MHAELLPVSSAREDYQRNLEYCRRTAGDIKRTATKHVHQETFGDMWRTACDLENCRRRLENCWRPNRDIRRITRDIWRTAYDLEDCRSYLELSKGLEPSPVEPVKTGTNVTESRQNSVKTKLRRYCVERYVARSRKQSRD